MKKRKPKYFYKTSNNFFDVFLQNSHPHDVLLSCLRTLTGHLQQGRNLPLIQPFRVPLTLHNLAYLNLETIQSDMKDNRVTTKKQKYKLK